MFNIHKTLQHYLPILMSLFGACATIGPRNATIKEQSQINQEKYMTGDESENIERDVQTKPPQIYDPKLRIEINNK